MQGKLFNNDFEQSNTYKADKFEDICAVYVDDVQHIKSTFASSRIFKNTYFKNGDELNIITDLPLTGKSRIRVVYYQMPELKSVATQNGNEEVVTGGNVMIPVEFIPLVKAKLRAEMYKIANEDGFAAKWMNDYNILLETFKQWIINKKPKFGIE